MNAVETSLISETLRELFSTDEELLTRFHIAAGSGLDGCVKRTAEDLGKACEGYRFFRIEKEGSLIGFFGAETLNGVSALSGFFIHPSYRKGSRIAEVWNLINNYFQGKPFVTLIYSKNTRAIKFLVRNGARGLGEFNHDGHDVQFLGFNLGDLQCL